MNITKSIVDENGVVTVTVTEIGEDYFNKLLETRCITYEEQSPNGDDVGYRLTVCLGGSDMLYSNSPFGEMTLQINENGYSGAAPYVLSGYGEQDRSTFIARVNALFDTAEGIIPG